MTDYYGRDLAFALDMTHSRALIRTAASCDTWLDQYGSTLNTGPIENAPVGAIIFWRGGRYGECAIAIGKGRCIKPSGIYPLPTADGDRIVGKRYAGWIDPKALKEELERVKDSHDAVYARCLNCGYDTTDPGTLELWNGYSDHSGPTWTEKCQEQSLWVLRDGSVTIIRGEDHTYITHSGG